MRNQIIRLLVKLQVSQNKCQMCQTIIIKNIGEDAATISLMYNMSKRGPRMGPCGTLLSNLHLFEIHPLTFLNSL